MFSLNFSTRKETGIALEGGYFLDLGALSSPPTVVSLPRYFPQNSDTRAKRFLVGNYYYMTKGPLSVLLQITDFTAGPRTEIEKRWYGTTERATGRLTFRFISSDKGIDDLNRLLAGKPVETQTSTPVKPPPGTTGRRLRGQSEILGIFH